jgi:hypothetical protein
MVHGCDTGYRAVDIGGRMGVGMRLGMDTVTASSRELSAR